MLASVAYRKACCVLGGANKAKHVKERIIIIELKTIQDIQK